MPIFAEPILNLFECYFWNENSIHTWTKHFEMETLPSSWIEKNQTEMEWRDSKGKKKIISSGSVDTINVRPNQTSSAVIEQFNQWPNFHVDG